LGFCRLFELFTSTLDVILHKARNEGQLDSGIVDIKANKIEMRGPPKVTSFGEILAHSFIFDGKRPSRLCILLCSEVVIFLIFDGVPVEYDYKLTDIVTLLVMIHFF
jgi:hypothetical protein